MHTSSGNRAGRKLERFLGIRLGNSAAQTLTTGTPTALTFDTVRFNTFNFARTTSRVIIPRDGFYFISGHVTFAANATGIRRAVLMLNGATEMDNVTVINAGGVFTTQISLGLMIQLVTNDFVELFARQDSGGNLDSSGGTIKEPAFTVVYMGPSSS